MRARILQVRNKSVFSAYSDLLKDMSPDIKNILVLVEIMLTISASTASCERGFSVMNREKTTLRTCLQDSTLDDILRITVDGVPLALYSSNMSIEQWISSAKAKRHLKGHALTGSRGQQKITIEKLKILEQMDNLEEEAIDNIVQICD